jgi:hypothetical protein
MAGGMSRSGGIGKTAPGYSEVRPDPGYAAPHTVVAI